MRTVYYAVTRGDSVTHSRTKGSKNGVRLYQYVGGGYKPGGYLHDQLMRGKSAARSFAEGYTAAKTKTKKREEHLKEEQKRKKEAEQAQRLAVSRPNEAGKHTYAALQSAKKAGLATLAAAGSTFVVWGLGGAIGELRLSGFMASAAAKAATVPAVGAAAARVITNAGQTIANASVASILEGGASGVSKLLSEGRKIREELKEIPMSELEKKENK